MRGRCFFWGEGLKLYGLTHASTFSSTVSVTIHERTHSTKRAFYGYSPVLVQVEEEEEEDS